MRALSCLNTVSEVKKIPSHLPPKFKLYLSYVDTESPLKRKVFFDSKNESFYKLPYEIDKSKSEYLNTESDDFPYMCSVDELEVEHSTPEELIGEGLLFFGGNDISQLYIGISQERQDKIYICKDWYCDFKEISDDIFDFYLRLFIKDSDRYLISIGVDKAKLYRRFDEDFWRCE